MKTSDLIKIADLKLINKGNNKSINDFYSCDLMSFVLGHDIADDSCLITIINSMNVIAVCSLLNYSAIIFPEGVYPKEDVINKADQENIALFTSNLSSLKIYKEILMYED